MRQTIHDLTNDETVLRIMELLKTKHRTEKDLTDALGLANGTFTRWKYRNSKSYYKYIDRIAEYLDVPSSYLKEGINEYITVADLTPAEVRLVSLYRKMDLKRKEILMQSAEYYYDSLRINENGK